LFIQLAAPKQKPCIARRLSGVAKSAARPLSLLYRSTAEAALSLVPSNDSCSRESSGELRVFPLFQGFADAARSLILTVGAAFDIPTSLTVGTLDQ